MKDGFSDSSTNDLVVQSFVEPLFDVVKSVLEMHEDLQQDLAAS